MSERACDGATGVGECEERACGSARDRACHSACERACPRVRGCVRAWERVSGREAAAGAARGRAGTRARSCRGTRVRVRAAVGAHRATCATVLPVPPRLCAAPCATPCATVPLCHRARALSPCPRRCSRPAFGLCPVPARRGHVALPAQSPSARNASREVTGFGGEREKWGVSLDANNLQEHLNGNNAGKAISSHFWSLFKHFVCFEQRL